jgi:DNA polymerase-3 subunit delta'
MSLDSIIGQPFAVDLCRNWLKRKTTHPLLFYGPEGAGKKSLALEVAKALNPGGEKKIDTGIHPDVRVIDMAWQAMERKEPLEKQQNLRIETVMNERHRLLQSPVEGAWKVSILDEAHRLTADAANVLLKILEEPPANTAIFLLTPFRDRLFATILSRCQPVRFRYLEPKLTHEQIEEHRQAEELWQSLSRLSPSEVTHQAGGRKFTKPTRAEIQQQIESLLVPAARALRAGDMRASEPIRHIQGALTQLRQNVQPALVYDYLLLRLSKDRK